MIDNWTAGTSVINLSGGDFDNNEPWILKRERCGIVLFYANWCGHCNNLKPEYVKFADVAQFIKVYAVDADENKSLLERLRDAATSPIQINGFPTIWMYVNGKPLKQYTGNRSWQDLLQTAMGLCKAECECDSSSATK